MTKHESEKVKKLLIRVACEAYFDNIAFEHGPIFPDGIDGAIFEHTPEKDYSNMEYWNKRIDLLFEGVGLKVD